jgi:DNA mismatch repair protein MutS
LDGLVEKSRHAKEWIANLEQVERQRLDIRTLKVGYNKVFGYYIEVTNSQVGKVPPEYIRKQTIANGERFITPDLKEYETLVLNADERRLEIEQRIFAEVCSQIAAHGGQLLSLAAGPGRTRRAGQPGRSRADAALRAPDGGRRPGHRDRRRAPPGGRTDADRRTVRAQRHDLVAGERGADHHRAEHERQEHLFAPDRAHHPAGADRQLCARGRARIGVVDRIFTRLGASDEIHRGQSTFMVEMVETANILNHATSRSLLVLDEIGRGTSTYDGLAIAWAVIEYIHNHPKLRAKTLFATHYHELTDLAERLPYVVNYNVAVDDSGGGEDVVFLRRIIPGKADRSYGVHVARMAGLPLAAVNRAEEILTDLERSGAAGPRRLYEPEAKRGRSSAATQVSLFAEVHPAVEALRKLDVNGLTPLDALNRLYELQKLAQ